MSRYKTALLAAGLLAGTVGLAAAQQAPTPAPAPAATQSAPAANAGPTYDPAQLPTVQGRVAQYTLSPRGDVDGLVLDDGTEVHFPPFLSGQLVYAVRPGDQVTIHGLKARVLPMVMAVSITNDATHATVAMMGQMGPREQATMEASGPVKLDLHGPRGELNGFVLQDGTIVRLPPPEAQRMAAQLAAGQTIYVSGAGTQNVLGTVIDARRIGPTKDHTTEIRGPMGGPKDGPMGGWMGRPGHHHGPDRGPDGGPHGGPGMLPGMNGPGNGMPPPPRP